MRAVAVPHISLVRCCRGDATVLPSCVCCHRPDHADAAVSVPELNSKTKVREQQQRYMDAYVKANKNIAAMKINHYVVPCHNVQQFFTFALRFWVFFQCLMLSNVPDPANSKWAKECTQEKVII